MQCQRRIILVGKIGNGKSSTANSILHRDAFNQRLSANAVTESCLIKSGINHANTIKYDVVDTPGLFDTNKSVSERALEIQRSVDICPEPHAILIVFSATNRMTADERFTIDMLRIMFGECIFDHSIVVFTHGNSFVSDLAFEEFWKQNEKLVDLIKLCGNRVVKIENTNDFLSENEGTQRIFEMIESMSDAGETVYRYTGLNTHRSVIEEHSKNYNGTGGIREEVSEMVKQIGKKMDTKLWTTMLYAEVLIGSDAVRERYVAGKAGAANSVAASALGSDVLNSSIAQKEKKTKAMQFQRRIIIVGKSGNGKSSTGNSILQREAFAQKGGVDPVTKTCMMESSIYCAETMKFLDSRLTSSLDYDNTIKYNVVDTPGLLDTQKSLSERALEIQRSVEICPEPHAFFILFRADNRMTADERFTIDMLRIMFGECIFKHSIVVFTHSENIDPNLAFQEFWEKNEVFVNLIKLCGNRVAKIENTDDFQTVNKGTQGILEMIERMSDAGERMYRYKGLETHRSVIEEHSNTYHGEGNIHDEISEMVRKIGKKVDKKEWKTMGYGVLIGAAAAGCLPPKTQASSDLGSAELTYTNPAGGVVARGPLTKQQLLMLGIGLILTALPLTGLF